MNLLQVSKEFGTQEKCIKFLTKLRWGNKPVCPRCNSDRVTKRKINPKQQKRNIPLLHCNKCNKDFSVLTKTIFEASRMPLTKWFMMICTMMNSKKGRSSLELSRDLGVAHRTAWLNQHKLRCAMLDLPTDLSGEIEIDTVYMGSETIRYRWDRSNPDAPQMVGHRSKYSKTPVIGIVERKGRLILIALPQSPTQAIVQEILSKYADIGQTTLIMSDDGTEFKHLKKYSTHETVNHSNLEYARQDEDGNYVYHTNTIEGSFSNLKGGIKGNFVSVSRKYLPFYLCEFAFKYSRRHVQKMNFDEILRKAMTIPNKVIRNKPIQSPARLAYG